jgi:HEAT repeat protein
VPETPEALTTEEAATLAEFARACKAAARAVQLYPNGHPAVATTLARVVQITSPDALRAPLKLTVRQDTLLLGDREAARPDAAVSELALLFHNHQVGQATIRPGGTLDAWHGFLLLLGRAPDAVRADGGIARLWAATTHSHVQLREIDYAEVLRERDGGETAVWNHLLAHCLQGDALNVDEAGLRHLLEIAGDSTRVSELMAAADTGNGDAGLGGSTAVTRLLRAIVDAVSAGDPSRLEPVLRNLAEAFANLSPDTLLSLLRQRGASPETPLVDAVVDRMSDGAVTHFVAHHVAAEGTATERLALAFQALVPDRQNQQRLLALAHDDVASSPLGRMDGFETKWDQVAEQMLATYTDEPFVPVEYARELSAVQSQATAIEGITDDPPDRISSWVNTIATTELRALDLALMLDLLRLESHPERWGGLMTPVVRLLEDLLLVGDFDAARELLGALGREAAAAESSPRRAPAAAAIEMLLGGPSVRYLMTHLATADDAQFETIKSLCVPLGEVLVKPLAEALAAEDRPVARERVTAMLLAFGSVGRRTIERLKHSDNPAIRRTAVHLIREFGGSDTLPDLTELLDDTEPQVHRAAIRAILNVGTDEAFRILERALETGSPHARDAIMQAAGMVRDERATPMFIYILRHAGRRGVMTPIYLRAIESLGALRDATAIEPLRDVLYGGEWWAPRRTATIRRAAAGALARIATPEATAVLQRAAARGSRGVRAAARSHLPLASRGAKRTEAGS